MLKTLISKIWAIILSPGAAWETIFFDKTEDEKQVVQYAGLLILCNVAAAFIGNFLVKDGFRFVHAFVYAIVTGIAYGGGLLCVFYLFTNSLKKYLHIIPDKFTNFRLLVYSSSLMLSISVITSLIPPLSVLKILNIYTIYIVWEGVGKCFKFEEKNRGNITMLLSAGILLFPVVVEKILLWIFPIAR